MRTYRELAMMLDAVERRGALEDRPEGARYISLSDTLARQVSAALLAEADRAEAVARAPLPPPIDAGVLESFVRAFSSKVVGCRATCNCGREFWDAANRGYTWDEGEVEALEASPNATGLSYAVERVDLEGRLYVIDCDCWKPRAARVIAFLREHDSAIAEFFDARARVATGGGRPFARREVGR